MDITARARKIITENGGTIDASNINWPEGTQLIESNDNGAWGNFSYREWMLPDGRCVCWDSDDREYQAAYSRDPQTKEILKKSST